MRTRNLSIGVICALLFQLPMLAFLFSGRSIFLTYWEFACYRYYNSLSLLHGDLRGVWVVQGIPMGCLQTQLLRWLEHSQPHNIGSVGQIGFFATATVWFAYLLVGAILLGVWMSRRGSVLSKVGLSVVAISIWPLARDYSLLLAPDYWIYEVPFYVLSTWATLRLLENYRAGELRMPGWLFFVLSGFWTGVAFLQKPSLMAIAALPGVAAVFLSASTWIGRVLRMLVLVGVAAAAHWFVFQLYFNLQWATGRQAYLHYWDWLLHHPDTGTSLAGSFGELLRWSNYLFVPVALGLIVLIAITVIAFRGGLSRPKSGSLWCLIAYLWVTIVGHAAVILKRPSGTSVVDAMFFAAFAIPIAIGLAGESLRRRLTGIVAVLAVVGSVCYQPVLAGRWSRVDDSATLRSIAAVRDRVNEIDRPLILLLPDNRIHPYTAEAFGLYTGHLNLEPQEFDEHLLPRALPPSLLRQQLFPGTFMVNRGENAQLVAAFNAGYVIMWGEGPGNPRIQDFFPEIDSLLRRPNVSHQVFTILPNGEREAHLAHRSDISVPTLR